MQRSGKSRVRWQLRVELLDVSPPVWRRLVVPAAISLPRLHEALQVALGWTNSHLHDFVIGGKRYAPTRFDRAEVNRALARLKA